MGFNVYLTNTPRWPQRVLLISKLSALEFLRDRNPELDESQILLKMREQGEDPEQLLRDHNLQIACEKNLSDILKKREINFRITKRIRDASRWVDWADLVVPVGGDGTFLLASKLIRNNQKPALGLDPRGRDNFFTVPGRYASDVGEIFEKLGSGRFEFLMRSRIRTVMNGEGLYREPYHVNERSRPRGERRAQALVRSTRQRLADALQPRERILPWLALNEVFMGEFLAARSISFRVQVDDMEERAVRASGICVCTGSGSRFWHRSMNLQTTDTVKRLAEIATGKKLTEPEAALILKKFHTTLIYPPEDPRMLYTIREMYRTSRCTSRKCCPERSSCRRIRVRSYGFDAGLVVDGCISLPFNDGTLARLEIRPEFSLRSVVLK